ncbi:MAG: YjhG/YagF family D-xylonate dehydratase [Planctomycetota bacterium]
MPTDDPLFGPADFDVPTTAPGPTGSLPLTDEMLRQRPSGDLFGLSQNAGMGWSPDAMLGPEVLLLSTQGGIRAPDGKPIALGYHTGHWEVGLLMHEAADVVRSAGGTPFAGFVSDPCDGRTQGTVGMFDSLPYRNDAAMVLRRLIRSLPTRKGVVGVATCDKGLPAMMIALAGCGDLPGVIVPGGVTLPPAVGEDAGKVQTIGARYSVGELSLEEAAELGCRACATPGGGCQFLGTAATAQVVAEALGMAVPHSALAPSGQPIWRDVARRSASAVLRMTRKGVAMRDVLSDAAVRNAMTVHAAFGGSTNLLLHIPAVAHAAKLARPSVDDWTNVNRRTPRLVDALPNGPIGHPTVRVFLAGGVPEVLVYLRELGLLELDVPTATGRTLDEVIDGWQRSERRKRLRDQLHQRDRVDPDDVILLPARAKQRGLTPTVCFPRGNLCPDGAVVKSTAIDPSVIDDDGVYRHEGPAKVFTTEPAAIAAIKNGGVVAGDVIALIGRGPIGCGMEECYQVTGALKHVSFGKHVALITDARFSGVSTGACIGHVGPEALAGGPVGRLRDGDRVRIEIDTKNLTGSVDAVDASVVHREPHPDLRADVNIPDDTRLWAALQQVGGGTWGGCVYDVDSIVDKLRS